MPVKRLKNLLVILTGLMLFCNISIKAQEAYWLDSMERVLNEATANDKKVAIYKKIVDTLWLSNPRRSLKYSEPAAKLALLNNLKEDEAALWQKTGVAYSLLGKDEPAVNAYLKAIRLYEHLKDNAGQFNVYNTLSSTYTQQGNIAKARETIRQLSLITDRLPEPKDKYLTQLYSQKSILFNLEQQLDSAIFHALRSLEISKAIAQKEPEKSVLACIDYNALGKLHAEQKRHETALQYFDSSIAVLDKMEAQNKDIPYSLCFHDLGNVLLQTGKYDEALHAIKKSNDYAEKAGSLSVVADNYQTLAAIYKKTGNYRLQAEALEKHYVIKDSLFSTDNKVKMVELESEYEIEKKNAAIAEKENENIVQRNQRNILLLFILLIVATLIILGFFYWRIRNKNEQLAHQNQLIQQQKEALQALNRVKDRLFSIISHDLRNPVATLKAFITMSEQTNLSAEKRGKYVLQTQKAVNNMAEMLDNLLIWANSQVQNTPPKTQAISINNFIADCISEVQAQADNKQIKLINYSDQMFINSDINMLTVSLRNLLTNAIKFSPDGSEIVTKAHKDLHNFYLVVSDHGVGLSKEQIDEINNNSATSTLGTKGEKGSGLGLYLVKELLQKMNGRLTVEKNAGKGSIFTLTLPLQ